ncbi:MAG: DNA repair protein RecN [Syntrophomonas sp.]
MLQEIYINNFVLIDELRLVFDEGLNVLSGETGAGKSIIIDALGLIMGERAKGDLIRDIKRKAVAEAVFYIGTCDEARSFLMDNDLLEDDEETIIISREISPTGRNSARINGRNVPAGLLKTLSGYLLDMHLQHEHLGLLRPDMYREYVDSFAPQSHSEIEKVKQVFDDLKKNKVLLEELEQNEQNRLQKLDFLNFQIKEIEQANLQPGEEEELQALKNRINNSKKLVEGSARMVELLYSREDGDSAYDLVSASLDTAVDLQDEFFEPLQASLQEISYALQDISTQLSSFRDGLDFEPGILEETEERLHEINRLKVKYGNNIQEIIQFLIEIRQERDLLEGSQAKKEQLQELIEVLQGDYFTLAAHLSEMRKRAALVLQANVNQELTQLNMPDLRFEVVVEARNYPDASGMDRVEFLFSPNPGEELRPLSRIASGGEISRFVLALKKALAEVYKVPTLIFDEIDVGVGGTALSAMAAKLYEFSRTHQVILVTHAPQVASYADQHYLIEKKFVEDKTITVVKELTENERIAEIARMLAGENYSPLSLEHAREMRKNSKG